LAGSVGASIDSSCLNADNNNNYNNNNDDNNNNNNNNNNDDNNNNKHAYAGATNGFTHLRVLLVLTDCGHLGPI
jgi:hypothetical protein